MRRVNLSFSEGMIDSYVSGVSSVTYEVNNAKYEVRNEYDRAMSLLSEAIENLNRAIEAMYEDQRVAREVYQHNETVLDKLKAQLQQLENLSVVLQKQQSAAYDAYRRAAAEETRIHNSPPKSTGDPEADRSAKQAWEQRYAAAQRAVRAADHAYYEAKQAYQRNLDNIAQTKQNIERVEQINRNLQQLIQQLDTSIGNAERQRNHFQSTQKKLTESHSDFQSIADRTEMNLDQCKEYGNSAASYVRDICDALAPNHNGQAYYNDVMSVYDLDALDTTARSLFDTCETISEENDVMTIRKNVHERTMQDAVIAEASFVLSEEQSLVLGRLSELRENAQNCQTASKSLYRYYELSGIRLR